MRDKKTHFFLDEISNIAQEEEDFELHVTLNVGGQLVTGTIISDTAFFKLEENECMVGFYKGFKNVRSLYFNETGTVFKEGMSKSEREAVPDFLCQHFLYLKNAMYLSGGACIPGEGMSMQVRVSDVSSFSIGSLLPNTL